MWFYLSLALVTFKCCWDDSVLAQCVRYWRDLQIGEKGLVYLWLQEILHIIIITQRELRRVFRQCAELCLIWLHDILHIFQQTQGHLFALTLTFLSPDVSALTPLQPSCLVPSDDPLAKFFSVHTPSISLHPSFVVLSSRLSSLSYASDVLVTTLVSRTPFTVCLPFFFPPFHPLAVEVRYDEEPENLPVFISINKTPCEMDWPRKPVSLPTTPSPLLYLPVVQQFRDCQGSAQAQSSRHEVAWSPITAFLALRDSFHP